MPRSAPVRTLVVLSATALTAAALPLVSAEAATPSSAEAVVYVTGTAGAESLVVATTDAPGTAVTTTAITGIPAADTIQSIDFRPSTGAYYALTSARKLYTLAPTGAATQLGTTTYSYTGTSADIDINPVPDAIRLIASSGENLRISPTTGAVLGTDTTVSAADTDGATLPVDDVAYSNNTPGAQSSTLYALTNNATQLSRVGGLGGSPSPNLGKVTLIAALPGLTNTAHGGFDISPNSGAAYALRDSSGVTALTSIDLSSGTQTNLGNTIAGAHALAVVPAAGAISFTQGSFVTREGDGPATLTLRRSGNVLTAATVAVSTSVVAPQTATTTDFTALTNQTVGFAAGASTATVTVPILDDAVTEPTDAFTVSLSSPSGATLGSPSTAVVSILDNDPADTLVPTVLISQLPTKLYTDVTAHGLNVPIICSEACTFTGTLTIDNSLVGTYSGALKSAGTVKALLVFSTGGRSLLASKLPAQARGTFKTRSLHLSIRAQDTAGNKAAAGSNFSIKRTG